MMRLLLACTLILILASTLNAVPTRTLEYGTVPQREHNPRQDEYVLSYYNFCAGQVFYWSGYCYGMFPDNAPLKCGTCFDLSDCPADCRHLDVTWFAWKRFTSWATVHVEIYCASDNCCPVGPPLAGVYWLNLNISTAWQQVNWQGLELCPCEETGGKFIVMITDPFAAIHEAPYSDINSYNIDVGCESDWRCQGHSYIYKNVVPYCDIYGMPAPMWVSGPDYGCTNPPPIPPGCHGNYYTTGFSTEFLIDCYVSCEGATETAKESWSEVKKLYK